MQATSGPVLAPQATQAALPPLYQILDELVELVTLAEDPELADDERVAIAEQIAKYVSAEIAGRKVDGICATLRECEARAFTAAEESKRLAKRAESWLVRFQRIKDSTLRAMQTHGVTKLETPTNRLRIQGNGGQPPLEVYAPNDVPVELRTYRLSLTGDIYALLFQAVATSKANLSERTALAGALHSAKWEPDGGAIRDAMRGPRVECPECKGILDVSGVGCKTCANTGAVAPTVPGARLLERGVHLRVE